MMKRVNRSKHSSVAMELRVQWYQSAGELKGPRRENRHLWPIDQLLLGEWSRHPLESVMQGSGETRARYRLLRARYAVLRCPSGLDDIALRRIGSLSGME